MAPINVPTPPIIVINNAFNVISIENTVVLTKRKVITNKPPLIAATTPATMLAIIL